MVDAKRTNEGRLMVWAGAADVVADAGVVVWDRDKMSGADGRRGDLN